MRALRAKQLIIPAVIGAVIAVLITACGGGKETDPVKLIPERATLIADVNLSGLLASDAFTPFYDAIPLDGGDSQTLDELLGEAMTETGLDLRRISQASVFLDLSEAEEFFGIIAASDFDEAELISSIEEAAGSPIGTSDYRGRQLYHPEDDSGSFALTMLEGGTLAAGTPEAVRAVIDVQDGSGDRLSGDTMDAFNDLGPGLIRLQTDLRSIGLDQVASGLGETPFMSDGLDGLPSVVETLEDLRHAGMVLSQNGQTLAITANLDFASPEAASDLGDFLDGVLKLGAGLVPEAEQADLLRRIEISHSGPRLRIRLEATAAELAELLGG